MNTQPAEVVAIRHLAPDVRELVLQPLQHAVTFQPGQWISVHLPVGDAPDKPLVRAYTMAEPQSDDGTLVLCFDRVQEGAASTYLFGVEVGTQIAISDALGNFTRPKDLAAPQVFIASFTGIVPFHAMLVDMDRRAQSHQTLVLYGAPNKDELVYHPQIQELAARHAWLTYVPVGANTDTAIERFLARLPEELDRHTTGTAFHPMVCGIRAMVLPARAWLMESRGFTRKQVQKETYD